MASKKTSATSAERRAATELNKAKGMVKVAIFTRNGGFKLRMMTAAQYEQFIVDNR